MIMIGTLHDWGFIWPAMGSAAFGQSYPGNYQAIDLWRISRREKFGYTSLIKPILNGLHSGFNPFSPCQPHKTLKIGVQPLAKPTRYLQSFANRKQGIRPQPN
jgi:hypothetical protein